MLGVCGNGEGGAEVRVAKSRGSRAAEQVNERFDVSIIHMDEVQVRVGMGLGVRVTATVNGQQGSRSARRSAFGWAWIGWAGRGARVRATIHGQQGIRSARRSAFGWAR